MSQAPFVMKQDLLTQLSTAAESLPVFRHSAQQVLQLTADTQCKAADLIETIYNDPILALKVLKVVNSSHYNLNHKVTTVEHALVHMGINPIKNLLLPFTCKGAFLEDQALGFDARQYLLYLLGTADVARQLAIKMQYSDPTECFVAGLLHDFGKLAMAYAMPDAFAQAWEYHQTQQCGLHEALQQTMQLSYADISANLMQQWNFSPALVQAVRHQHQVQNNDMNICVFAAIQIVKHLHFGFGGDNHVIDFPDNVQQRLGGNLEHVIELWHDLNVLFENIKAKVQT
jgi:HD-like signal output (HDOD) protein